MKWFKHNGRNDGSYNWADGNGREIGSGWQIHPTVLAAQDGQIFGFCGGGTIWWHKWVLTNAATGAGYWAPGTNNIIHRGFGQYSYVFGGWDGVFYAVDARGDMYWFRYLAGDGSNGPGAWANNGRPIHVGTGFDWGSCVERFAENGVVYCVWVNRDHTQPDHELRWYTVRTGSPVSTS